METTKMYLNLSDCTKHENVTETIHFRDRMFCCLSTCISHCLSIGFVSMERVGELVMLHLFEIWYTGVLKLRAN